MFKKILIANRGEIACRIIETARLCGIQTVAVYSEADETARHVRLADEAVCIGPAASAESYLKGDVIIEAARKTGAEAIHPGYGFLSENAEFSQGCADAGLVFIGPSAESILAMGLKDRAKDIMHKAGVPVVPGYQGEDQSEAVLQKEADAIGYPVLIKAVAGGGGKGMRLVEKAAEFSELLSSCKREAKASFNNDHVLIEKYITKPRHIEVQVFGDTHGNVVHLFERDCSLQRRHQKVIEEAPAPGIKQESRDAMGNAAVKAAEAISYHGAGTIEFIVDSETHDFYFMEMNTRLQVEHPVTEMITGQDLVKWQLQVAAGEELPLKQDELSIDGHSFEVRLYAEDPGNEFLPQTGCVSHFQVPDLARVDTGIEQGDAVSIHYDPMVAKIIVHGSSRDDALIAMNNALQEMKLSGLTTNLEFLANVCKHEAFRSGDVNTGFIEHYADELIPPHYGRPEFSELALAAVYYAMSLGEHRGCAHDPWSVSDNWRMGSPLARTLLFSARELLYTLKVICRGPNFDVEYDGKKITVQLDSWQDGSMVLRSQAGNIAGTLLLNNSSDTQNLTILSNGRFIALHHIVPGADEEDAVGEGRILASMPGKIVSVLVAAGDEVEKDQPLLVMEAMKMEMTIRAGCDGIVEELPVAVNDQVEDGALLVHIEQETA